MTVFYDDLVEHFIESNENLYISNMNDLWLELTVNIDVHMKRLSDYHNTSKNQDRQIDPSKQSRPFGRIHAYKNLQYLNFRIIVLLFGFSENLASLWAL